MAITDDITLGITAAHLKDLTDPAINPLAVATATPREGGFVCRNRINFGSATVDGVNSSCDITMPASALSTTNVVCNQLYVLDIPKRTTVKTLKLYAIAGEDAPTHAYRHKTAAASAGSSSNNAHTLQFSAKAYKKEDQSAFATVVAGNCGELDLAQMGTTSSVIDQTDLNGGIPNAVSASSTGTPTNCVARITVAGANGAQGANTYDNDTYFPFGGKIVMNLAGASAWENTSSIANDFTGHAQGVWELQADCNYIPE